MLSPCSSDFEFKLWPGITMTVREVIGYELGEMIPASCQKD